MAEAGTDLETMETGIGFARPGAHKGGRPPGHTNAKTTDRRRQVARLLAMQGGMTGDEVAEAVGVSKSTASRDIAAVKKLWREEMIEHVDVMVARDLAELGMVKQEAWWVYQQSIENGEHTETETVLADGKTITTTVTSNPKADLHALKLVQSCIERKRKILGMDKEGAGGGGAKLVSFTVRIGDRILVSEASTINPEEDILDAEMVELDSAGKALPSGTED